MRVGFDATLSARVSTGVGVYAREVRRSLIDLGIDMLDWQAALGPRGRGWARARRGVRLASWLTDGCRRRARGEDVDLVHATAALGPLRLPCPLVMTIHDATALSASPRLVVDRALHRVYGIGAARRAEAIVAPSKSAAAEIAAHYGVPPARIRVVPLGVSEAYRGVPAADRRAAMRRCGLDRPYVLCVGADVPRKNLSRVMAAMGREPALADLDLVIAGPVTARPRPAPMRHRHVRPVRRLGEVDAAWLPGLYAGAACLAYVSLHEGFGLPILEAMAAGTPVLTSDRASMPEVAGDAALLVDPTNVEAIADAIRRLVFDRPLADRLRARGHARSARFSWAATARLTADVYRDVTGLALGQPLSA